MKKLVIIFKQNGRKFNTRKNVTEVTEFSAETHEGSKVDKFGRVVHGARFSETAFAMTRSEWNDALKAAKCIEDEITGCAQSPVYGDPSLLVEFAYDNGISLGSE